MDDHSTHEIRRKIDTAIERLGAERPQPPPPGGRTPEQQKKLEERADEARFAFCISKMKERKLWPMRFLKKDTPYGPLPGELNVAGFSSRICALLEAKEIAVPLTMKEIREGQMAKYAAQRARRNGWVSAGALTAYYEQQEAGIDLQRSGRSSKRRAE